MRPIKTYEFKGLSSGFKESFGQIALGVGYNVGYARICQGNRKYSYHPKRKWECQ
jgi:hypothetical protein